MNPINVRKKPVTVAAMQNTRAQYMDVYKWIERNTLGSFDMTEYEGDDAPELPASGVSIDPSDGRMVISTLEGMHWVDLDDWVIRGVHGEFYPCKPDIFAETYEIAEALGIEQP